MKLVRCDNPPCGKDIPEQLVSYELITNYAPGTVTLSTDITDKQFCCLGCVAEYAATVCGWIQKEKKQ